MLTLTSRRLRDLALAKAYGAKGMHELSEIKCSDYPIWQSPFLKKAERILKEATLQAGALWLRNFDLVRFQRLIIWHPTEMWSYCFMRALQRGSLNQTLGPLNEKVVLSGKEIFQTGLRYLEFDVWREDDA